MVDVEEYLKKAGGQWLRADNVVIGDRLEVLDEGVIDDQSFDRAYLVLQVKLLRTGEQYSLRLGPKNVKRIVDSWGGEKDTKKWVGRQLEVISIETYAGLGQKGILLRGVPVEPKQTVLSSLSKATLDYIQAQKTVIQYCLDTNAPLNESDFNEIPIKVRAELLKFGLISKTAQGYAYTEKIREYLK